MVGWKLSLACAVLYVSRQCLEVINSAGTVKEMTGCESATVKYEPLISGANMVGEIISNIHPLLPCQFFC